jgi:CheY-like chemotaxis protein
MKQLKNIFIVDDDEMQSSMLQDYLSKYSTFNVHIFTSGEDCIKNLELNPDVIFLDYNFDKAGKSAMYGIMF